MRTLLRILPIVLLGALLFSGFASGVTYVLRRLDLYPPESLSIAAGMPGSAYYESALRYQEILAQDEIRLEILETAGSVANAASLAQENGADIALVQGGVPLPEEIVGLAAVRVEPLWIMTRSDLPGDPHEWTGLRVSAGTEGSGTRLIADKLATITGASILDRSNALTLTSTEAAQALLAGTLDASLFVAPVEAAYLQDLLQSDVVNIRSLVHSEAVALRLPGAQQIRMPSGLLDYDRPLPAEDLEIIALVTRLVAREDLHPAIVNRLLHAVFEVHRGDKVLPADRRYPASINLGVPADAYAEQLLEQGFSPLEDFLPYWIVAQLNRVLLVLVPALILLLPLMRMLPAVYGAILNRRVFRHYSRVHEIDETLANSGTALQDGELRNLRDELDAIEQKLLRANLPDQYRKQAFTLLYHIDYVRKRGEEILMQRAQS